MVSKELTECEPREPREVKVDESDEEGEDAVEVSLHCSHPRIFLQLRVNHRILFSHRWTKRWKGCSAAVQQYVGIGRQCSVIFFPPRVRLQKS